jgi:hypothetical protein
MRQYRKTSSDQEDRTMFNPIQKPPKEETQIQRDRDQKVNPPDDLS